MDYLYKNGKLCRDAYAGNKLLPGVDRAYGKCVPEEIIQQDVKSKKKQDKVRG